MATLTNQQINLTYPGLIKTTDNLGVDPTVLKQLTDGVGGSIPISVSQAQTKFASGSSVDFTGSTVTGIDAAGLVAGSGPDSMQSVSSLTPNPAAATGTSSIALGNASTASNTSSVAIGSSVTASKNGAVCIGDNGQAAGTDGCVRLGQNETFYIIVIKAQHTYCVTAQFRCDLHSMLSGIMVMLTMWVLIIMCISFCQAS